MARLRDNGKVLFHACREIAGALREERSITPAAEWLVENFHVVEEQIREIRSDLPNGYYRQLPKLATGPLEGYPRVFGVAWAAVAHTDSRLDQEALHRFVVAYQTVQPLTIGELWAFAITLRIVLVENLRRAAEGIIERRAARQRADALADRLLAEPGSAARLLGEDTDAPLSIAFAVQLVQRLRDHDPVVTPALRWLDSRLLAQGTNADELVAEEHLRQGAMNVTVRNVITSMRLLSRIDWSKFFESVSLVESALLAGSDHAAMDFPSRDRYRHAVEDLARGSRRTELDVVQQALAEVCRCRTAALRVDPSGGGLQLEVESAAQRRCDPGYYLLGSGRRAFEAKIGYRAPFHTWPNRAAAACGIRGYLFAVLVLVVAFVALLTLWLFDRGVSNWQLWFVGVLAAVPASEIAISMVNRRVTRQFGPLALPGLELRGGVPARLRTVVAVPTMLSSVAAIEAQVERLEVHFLASPDDDLCFLLLSDWTDADHETEADDDQLLAAARAGIARLNRQYDVAPCGDRFRLLHRRRVWNACEDRWIGWERKRGKLHELDRWLRGALDTTFVAENGSANVPPPGVRYVITLDADTRLPRGAARRLVGKLAHPLNRPTLDRTTGRVVEGHAVLQPRITPALPSGDNGSVFQRVFAGPCGIDPYACAVSDVYQDLLGEGSYTGKGIYEIDAFESALAGRVPENTVLSHDLLEGIFARAGLVSDIELVEDFPSRYDVAAARQHRWARGDWQLLPWIFGRGRDQSGEVGRAAVPLAGRWKMLDNLRRTLIAPVSFLLLVFGWGIGGFAAVGCTAFVLALFVHPVLSSMVSFAMPLRFGSGMRRDPRALNDDFVQGCLRFVLGVSLLAHQAWLMSDAIVRTVSRLFVRRQCMLEWLTAAQAQFALPLDHLGFLRRMAGSVVVAGITAVGLVFADPTSRLVAGPIVLLWLAAPVVAGWASRSTLVPQSSRVTDAERSEFRRMARRTWTFFESYVTPVDNHLPPDNLQEDDELVLATRTSPTNIGLYLLSVAAARDFGWIGTHDAVARVEATLDSVARMEHWHGHLFNWYDTRDLRPLEPRYVSSVDSGNFAGHLIALGGACRDQLDGPAVDLRRGRGLADVLGMLAGARQDLAFMPPAHAVTLAEFDTTFAAVERVLADSPSAPGPAVAQFDRIAALLVTLADIAEVIAAERADAEGAELLRWTMLARHDAMAHCRDDDRLLSWARFDLGATAAEAAAESDALGSLMTAIPTLRALPEQCESAIRELARRGTTPRSARLVESLRRSADAARGTAIRLTALQRRIADEVEAMDFAVLFDSDRELLAIGFQVGEGKLDQNCYDLLASEARLASFVAIAKGEVPVRHWFRLGRSMVTSHGEAALVSWSGSMFEYLMPSLVMQAPEGSLLEQTGRHAVQRHVRHGRELGVPWGVSESAYNIRNLEQTYQYSSFGVEGLGQKHGLRAANVVAPYASALAVAIVPRAALANLQRIAAIGGSGQHGFYDSLDYTASRLPPSATVAIVRAYFAHHQGMILVAIGNVIHDGVMCTRFHSDAAVQATELLLQERVPRGLAVVRSRAQLEPVAPHDSESVPPTVRRFHSPHGRVPRTHLLSNGRYVVMLTAAGSGYSRCGDVAVTRWHEDVTCDPWGSYIFLRDLETNGIWSAGYQPTGVEADEYEVSFTEGRADIRRRDGSIEMTMSVVVSPEADAEVRRISILNTGSEVRELEVTSYAEVVLAPRAADASHPAFAKMFVETEYVASVGALVATRRRRSGEEVEAWAAHLAVVEGEGFGEQEHESDRARFLGRGHDVRRPTAMTDARPLSRTVGTVLDPVFVLRRRIRLRPGAVARVSFWTMLAPSRTEVLDLVDKCRDATAFERAATLCWTQAQVQLQHLGIGPEEAHLFQRLANRVLYSDPSLRPPAEVLLRNQAGPSSLWSCGISGDLPIVLVRIDEAEDLEIVRQLLRAHQYWRMKQLAVDLVILNERSSSYVQDLEEALHALLRSSQPRSQPSSNGAHGRVVILRADVMTADARNLLPTVARAVLYARRGSLAEQVRRRDERARVPPSSRSSGFAFPLPHAPAPFVREKLEFWNGLGGFADSGREYVTVLGSGQWTPAPWLNVVSNPHFGFQVTVEGGGYTWSLNSRENQLTPWSNDPVSDRSGEAFYVLDLDSGALWCPTASPIRLPGSNYVARHGQGFSRFQHTAHEIELELLQYVPLVDSIKISRLRLTNRSNRPRRLAVTAFVEWVLGTARGQSAHHLATEFEATGRTVLVRNPWRAEFGQRVAFADLGGRASEWTCDRTEFLGRNGALGRPSGLRRSALLGRRCGAGLDPCAALQTAIELDPGEQTEIVFFLGDAATRAEAIALVARYRAADLDAVLSEVEDHWDATLGVVQVRTPERSMDILLNRWLLYQALACRVWARAAFYQQSGAYGFRDQLQDVMALAVARPEITRAHLLRAAARQFEAGDVQHWWLPHSERGVRTRIADDSIWLAYAVAHYIAVTGDAAVLDAKVPFLEGPLLAIGEVESYFQPSVGASTDTLFEHCSRALDRSLPVGSHGLPLIGTGDWNDGMNRVGVAGRGESVWLGWFLHASLTAFLPLAEARGEHRRVAAWRQHCVALQGALDRDGWDGDWYRRGFYDDGSALGSAANVECRIDSIAQSWAVISGAGDPARAVRAMASVREHLVDERNQLILLFTPPFDRDPADPGYVKGYPPGLRENGGQYTHAAVWAVIATAMTGDGDGAFSMFSILDPIRRTSTRAGMHRYRVEPYVACADVYSVAPHVGLGGWTWYTGAAGWLHRAGLEWILGFRKHGSVLMLSPCVPAAWPRFEIDFRHGATRYRIVVENPRHCSSGLASLHLDGVAMPVVPPAIPLVDDGAVHVVTAVLGS